MRARAASRAASEGAGADDAAIAHGPGLKTPPGKALRRAAASATRVVGGGPLVTAAAAESLRLGRQAVYRTPEFDGDITGDCGCDDAGREKVADDEGGGGLAGSLEGRPVQVPPLRLLVRKAA